MTCGRQALTDKIIVLGVDGFEPSLAKKILSLLRQPLHLRRQVYKPFIVEMVQPILSGLSPLAFVVVTMLIATILTNFANNMVVAAGFATLIFSIAVI